jgi:hypothetical protein
MLLITVDNESNEVCRDLAASILILPRASPISCESSGPAAERIAAWSKRREAKYEILPVAVLGVISI